MTTTHRRNTDADAEQPETDPADPHPNEYVPQFCSALDLSEETESKAHEIVDASIEAGITENRNIKASGVAAGAVYSASLLKNEKRTQLQVAATADVTIATVRNRYREQMEAEGVHL